MKFLADQLRVGLREFAEVAVSLGLLTKDQVWTLLREQAHPSGRYPAVAVNATRKMACR